MKILVLVLDSDTPNSIRNSAVQKSTWVKDFLVDNKVLFYKAGDEIVLTGIDLLVDCSNTYEAMGVKTIKALEWVNLNIEYDFIFRTNTSSYVNHKNLIKYLNKLSSEGIDYCGHIGLYDGIEYVSGSGIILSKHAVKSILNSKNQLDESVVEDIAIGKLLKINNILPTQGKRKDIESHNDIRNFDSDEYHIRCRIDSFGYSRNLESYLLRYIHKNLHKKKKLSELFMVIYMKVNKSTLIIQKKIKNIIKSVLNKPT